MEKKLLITGFDPFGELKENPSWMAVSGLPGQAEKNMPLEQSITSLTAAIASLG